MSLAVSTSSGPSGQEKALQLALEHGIITQEEHDRQLSEHRAEPAPPRVHVPTRQHGDKVVATHKGMWRPIAGPFPSKELALAARNTVEAGKWKWNTAGCRKHLRCDAHKDCPVLMRVTESAAQAAALGGYYLDILNVDHSREEKLFTHARAKMSDAEKESVRRRMEDGKRPREMSGSPPCAWSPPCSASCTCRSCSPPHPTPRRSSWRLPSERKGYAPKRVVVCPNMVRGSVLWHIVSYRTVSYSGILCHIVAYRCVP